MPVIGQGISAGHLIRGRGITGCVVGLALLGAGCASLQSRMLAVADSRAASGTDSDDWAAEACYDSARKEPEGRREVIEARQRAVQRRLIERRLDEAEVRMAQGKWADARQWLRAAIHLSEPTATPIEPGRFNLYPWNQPDLHEKARARDAEARAKLAEPLLPVAEALAEVGTENELRRGEALIEQVGELAATPEQQRRAARLVAAVHALPHCGPARKMVLQCHNDPAFDKSLSDTLACLYWSFMAVVDSDGYGPWQGKPREERDAVGQEILADLERTLAPALAEARRLVAQDKGLEASAVLADLARWAPDKTPVGTEVAEQRRQVEAAYLRQQQGARARLQALLDDATRKQLHTLAARLAAFLGDPRREALARRSLEERYPPQPPEDVAYEMAPPPSECGPLGAALRSLAPGKGGGRGTLDFSGLHCNVVTRKVPLPPRRETVWETEDVPVFEERTEVASVEVQDGARQEQYCVTLEYKGGPCVEWRTRSVPTSHTERREVTRKVQTGVRTEVRQRVVERPQFATALHIIVGGTWTRRSPRGQGEYVPSVDVDLPEAEAWKAAASAVLASRGVRVSGDTPCGRIQESWARAVGTKDRTAQLNWALAYRESDCRSENLFVRELDPLRELELTAPLPGWNLRRGAAGYGEIRISDLKLGASSCFVGQEPALPAKSTEHYPVPSGVSCFDLVR